jgi:branched-chain amino acid transport system permease protein
MLGAFFGSTRALVRAGAGPEPVQGAARAAREHGAAARSACVIERLAYKPVRKSPRLSALITAIGVSLLLENGGVLLFGADPKFFPQIVPQQNIPLGARRHDLEPAAHRHRWCRSC